jgi:crotonobetainyl-CoA:carnitine CoA-transferase CaiB-like acyl-CoA transferase
MSGSRVEMVRAPLLGEHTDAVLAAELGLSADELADVAAAGVTRPARAPAAVVSGD